MLRPASERISHTASIPAWLNWKPASVTHCSRPKRIPWSPAAIPKTVKHPSWLGITISHLPNSDDRSRKSGGQAHSRKKRDPPTHHNSGELQSLLQKCTNPLKQIKTNL